MGKLCKIGLALGGGGARGLAHLGVLCALEREGIPIDRIAGTSMGALIGSLYAHSPSCDVALERFRLYLESKEFHKTNPDFLFDHSDDSPGHQGIFHRFSSLIKKGIFYTQSLTKRAPISEENFAQNINFLLDDVQIEQGRIPLAVVALDLKSGEEVLLNKGPLRRAVTASCAIPGILPPVHIDDRELVDGGWINRVPVRPLKAMGADFVIAVNVVEGPDDSEDYQTGLGIVMRANEIARWALSQMQTEEDDVIITPDVCKVHWADFRRLDECLRAGEEAALKKIAEIRRGIKTKGLKKIFRFPFRFRPLPNQP
jgi:NTE family protein